MDVLDLFGYQANLNNMLSRIGKRLAIEFFCDIHLYDGVVETNFIDIATPVDSLAQIKEALYGEANYYLNSNPTIELSDDIISEIMEELDFAKIDTTKPGDIKSTRWDSIVLIDDDNVSVECSFSLEIVDI